MPGDLLHVRCQISILIDLVVTFAPGCPTLFCTEIVQATGEDEVLEPVKTGHPLRDTDGSISHGRLPGML